MCRYEIPYLQHGGSSRDVVDRSMVSLISHSNLNNASCNAATALFDAVATSAEDTCHQVLLFASRLRLHILGVFLIVDDT